MPSSAKSVFILDFDGTITTKDTISALFQAAVGFHAAHGNGKSTSEALLDIQTQYAKDFSNHLDSWIHSKPEDARAVQEVITYQQCLKPVEIMSFNRVSTSGIFEGIGTDIWRELGVAARKTMAKVSVRPGFEEFVEKIKEIGGQWGIVSVNFSEEWIRGVLGNHLRDVEILANQPDETGQLKGPKDENGNRGELMVTSDGKLAAMKVMLRRLQMEPGTSRVVYVGDSGTDFECLLEGGVIGIVMVEEDGTSKLLDTFKRVSSDPEYMFLENFQEIKEYDEGRGKALYFARDFQEIVESNLFE